jgi:hypothetical protein
VTQLADVGVWCLMQQQWDAIIPWTSSTTMHNPRTIGSWQTAAVVPGQAGAGASRRTL